MIISISSDNLSEEEMSFLKSAFDTEIEMRIFANSGHKQLSEEINSVVPVLIHFTISAVMSGATWDILKESLLYLFRNRTQKLSKDLTIRISAESSIITITEGKKVIDSSSKHIVIEGATEDLITDIVLDKNNELS